MEIEDILRIQDPVVFNALDPQNILSCITRCEDDSLQWEGKIALLVLLHRKFKAGKGLAASAIENCMGVPFRIVSSEPDQENRIYLPPANGNAIMMNVLNGIVAGFGTLPIEEAQRLR